MPASEHSASGGRHWMENGPNNCKSPRQMTRHPAAGVRNCKRCASSWACFLFRLRCVKLRLSLRLVQWLGEVWHCQKRWLLWWDNGFGMTLSMVVCVYCWPQISWFDCCTVLGWNLQRCHTGPELSPRSFQSEDARSWHVLSFGLISSAFGIAIRLLKFVECVKCVRSQDQWQCAIQVWFWMRGWSCGFVANGWQWSTFQLEFKLIQKHDSFVWKSQEVFELRWKDLKKVGG